MKVVPYPHPAPPGTRHELSPTAIPALGAPSAVTRLGHGPHPAPRKVTSFAPCSQTSLCRTTSDVLHNVGRRFWAALRSIPGRLIFLPLKWRLPLIHSNSSWLALFWPPRSFCLFDDRPNELELPEDVHPESVPLLLLSDDEEVESGDPHRPLLRLDDLCLFFSLRRSFFLCFFDLCFCFFLCSFIFILRAPFPDLSQSSKIL